MSRDVSAVDIMASAYAASLKIVAGQNGSANTIPPSDGDKVAASNLAIALFSFEAEAAPMQPPSEDDETLEG